MSLLVDMKSLITAVNANMFLGDLPDTPDNCIALYQTGGQDSQHQLGASTDEVHETPTFQVRIRNTSYATANTEAESVKDILDGLVNQTINTNEYKSIFMQGDINSLGRDDRNRINLTVNFIAKVKRS